ncbi:LytTR family transcriptional regulator DNA-binding domain-containing protein [Salipiger bermudensis]|uniref:MHYT domain-containing protein n=1 Tax=Salipiger bermudensis TaxID=344736 RepID=UPI001C996E16|nr:MHYT domain-containing protein [Salipiger bermudensis]MBY6004164.1 LytTR family transcriptional regulator DNA-binding domain-containing protein [Salipiger bermudensis]
MEEFLAFGHDPWLVVASLVVALVAGATGLSLTRDMARRSVPQRKLAVALASVALGGGIWSMHFVAMLGLQLPILFFYDAAITLASALVAILMVALALVLLHFTTRTRGVIVAAGAIVGAGILAMHYIGMAGMQLCRPVYTPAGLILSSVLAIGLCVLAFGIAYGVRSNRTIALGTLCFGAAVFAVHFLAMAGTRFVARPEVTEFGPLISNEVMALGVILSSFVLFGAFLWVGATFLGGGAPVAGAEAPPASAPRPDTASEPATAPRQQAEDGGLNIPCEREGTRVLVRARDVAFLRADGHYTQVYTDTERYFCVWPITEAGKRLLPRGFLKVHRSYVVNPEKVARFERSKDKGACAFASEAIPPVPVSRSRLKDVQAALSAQVVATRAG